MELLCRGLEVEAGRTEMRRTGHIESKPELVHTAQWIQHSRREGQDNRVVLLRLIRRSRLRIPTPIPLANAQHDQSSNLHARGISDKLENKVPGPSSAA